VTVVFAVLNLQNYIQAGRIGKPQGLKGEVRVVLFSGMSDVLRDGRKIVLQNSDSEYREFFVQTCRWQGKHLVARLEGVTNRDDSELLNGYDIWISKSELPALAANQHYLFEYEGLTVVTDTGLELGVVQNVFATGANDVLVVAGQGREYLIPIIEDVLVEVDTTAGKIVISPLPGLLDINNS
jgi:16S rRNA processing protein RimM